MRTHKNRRKTRAGIQKNARKPAKNGRKEWKPDKNREQEEIDKKRANQKNRRNSREKQKLVEIRAKEQTAGNTWKERNEATRRNNKTKTGENRTTKTQKGTKPEPRGGPTAEHRGEQKRTVSAEERQKNEKSASLRPRKTCSSVGTGSATVLGRLAHA